MPKTKTFNPADIVYGAKKPVFVEVAGDHARGGLKDGDILIVDTAAKKPRDGDIVLWNTPEGSIIAVFDCQYEAGFEEDSEIAGIAVGMVRRFPRKAKRIAKQSPANNGTVKHLHERLSKLERLPENEAERFRLESEIFRIENAIDEEWPDVVQG